MSRSQNHVIHIIRVVAALAPAILAMAMARPAAAQPYSIPWYTMDCGGGTSTSTDYELQGTIGQPDAQGTAVVGSYELAGGYWNTFGDVSCPADFNNDGRVSVQDIFDFLASWFGGCFAQASPPCNGSNADFNHSGAVTVQDIFDFLAAWFAKCPGY